jgi:hypothetical protein
VDALATRFVLPVDQAVRSLHPAAPILTAITDLPASHDHRWIQAEGSVP